MTAPGHLPHHLHLMCAMIQLAKHLGARAAAELIGVLKDLTERVHQKKRILTSKQNLHK